MFEVPDRFPFARRRRREVVWGLVVLTLGCGVRAMEPSAPLVFDATRRFTTPVWLNGEGPFQFALDTGAELSVVSESVALRARLWVHPNMAVRVTSPTGAQSSALWTARSLRGPNFERLDELLVSIPDAGLRGDGILGANLFAGCRLVLDFESASWALRPTGSREEGATLLPIERGKAGQWRTRVRLDGRDVVAVVDTGSARSFANVALASALGYTAEELRREPADSISGLNEFEAQGAAIEGGTLDMGGLEFQRPEFVVVDLPWWRTNGLADVPALILGVDLLSRLAVLAIDEPRGELQIRARVELPR